VNARGKHLRDSLSTIRARYLPSLTGAGGPDEVDGPLLHGANATAGGPLLPPHVPGPLEQPAGGWAADGISSGPALFMVFDGNLPYPVVSHSTAKPPVLCVHTNVIHKIIIAIACTFNVFGNNRHFAPRIVTG